jgi:hypothetical protein
MVFALEFRHIFGMVSDDDGNILPLKEELAIIKRVYG